MSDIVGQGHGREPTGDDRGKLEDDGYYPVPCCMQWRKQVSRPDREASKKEYEPDPSENDSVNYEQIFPT